ncbi:hypothetical protein [Roseateles paludis]|jgi:hypothetical protein|uniref:hypothetical protein n=1 Tax=Roseateles paludis TaxID=3145238 RepID=UPI00325FA882
MGFASRGKAPLHSVGISAANVTKEARGRYAQMLCGSLTSPGNTFGLTNTQQLRLIPPPLIDWAVWANLDRYRDTELILLKGHLLLEVMLSESLRARLSRTETQIRKLSFREKLKALAPLTETDQALAKALKFLEQLNWLRNKLAHEPFPGIRTELATWSDQVLSVFATRKHQRYTPRTRITQAISALAKSVYESAHSAAQLKR